MYKKKIYLAIAAVLPIRWKYSLEILQSIPPWVCGDHDINIKHHEEQREIHRQQQ